MLSPIWLKLDFNLSKYFSIIFLNLEIDHMTALLNVLREAFFSLGLEVPNVEGVL